MLGPPLSPTCVLPTLLSLCISPPPLSLSLSVSHSLSRTLSRSLALSLSEFLAEESQEKFWDFVEANQDIEGEHDGKTPAFHNCNHFQVEE